MILTFPGILGLTSCLHLLLRTTPFPCPSSSVSTYHRLNLDFGSNKTKRSVVREGTCEETSVSGLPGGLVVCEKDRVYDSD